MGFVNGANNFSITFLKFQHNQKLDLSASIVLLHFSLKFFVFINCHLLCVNHSGRRAEKQNGGTRGFAVYDKSHEVST